mmetsp:Transcript_32417/g.74475  ORF Transcript_32417/g.74475 Transcript_32417/m.74475 type:complete len:195 (-) Transcript_32417:215-799(-)
MKLAVLLTFFGSVAAFAPASQTKPTTTTSLQGWKDEMIVGVTPPVGFFDPVGLSRGKDDKTMNLYREAELKHGRVAMAACLGWYITAGGIHPAFNSELSSDPLAAAQQLAPVGWLQFVLGCGAIEWLGLQIAKNEGYRPGDWLGMNEFMDPTGEDWIMYQNKEINNGRLAMLAISGMFVQDLFFGNYGDMIFKR